MTRTPAFRHVGGDILFWAKPLTTDDVNHLRALYREEAWAAFHAGDDADYQRCADILKEIVDAMSEQARWMRCADLNSLRVPRAA